MDSVQIYSWEEEQRVSGIGDGCRRIGGKALDI